MYATASSIEMKTVRRRMGVTYFPVDWRRNLGDPAVRSGSVGAANPRKHWTSQDDEIRDGEQRRDQDRAQAERGQWDLRPGENEYRGRGFRKRRCRFSDGMDLAFVRQNDVDD
jgi:hypothetical protein